ncbi:MAG: serine/threonine-protein kinase, partial [Candidatus Eremiobacterota bacterium]
MSDDRPVGRDNSSEFCYDKSRMESSEKILLEDRYEILEIVKSGGMGTVYKALDTRLGGFVAVKKLLDFHSTNRDYSKNRFTEEARLLSKLHHSGLPKVIDFFITSDPETDEIACYLVMTFIEGKDLECIINERGGSIFPLDESIDYFRQILNILSYLHSQSPPVIYRDIKPSNIMIKEGHVFLVDFGIARVFVPQQKGTIIGTPGYSPPEQYKGFTSQISDIYSLGALMHYLLTGINPLDENRPPFKFEPVRDINPEVPEYIEKIVMSMVDMAVKNRPVSAEEILKLLDGCDIMEVEPVSTPVSRSKFMYIFTGIALFLFLGFFWKTGVLKFLHKDSKDSIPPFSSVQSEFYSQKTAIPLKPSLERTVVSSGSGYSLSEKWKIYSRGFAFTPSGNFYSLYDNRIQKFDSHGHFLSEWDIKPLEEWNKVAKPSEEFPPYSQGIVIDSFENIYVSIYATNHYEIQKFSSEGKFMVKWNPAGDVYDHIYAEQARCLAAGMAVDSFDNLYISDREHSKIQKFDSSGKVIDEWGTSGIEDGQFLVPYGIAVDLKDNVYVTDSGNFRIQKFNSDGEFLKKWGDAGYGYGQFNYPEAITLDRSMNVFVVDRDNNRIEKFDSNGKYITCWDWKGR